MSIKDIFNKVKKELKVVQGEDTKDKVYTNENTFADEAIARKEFKRAKAKLFDVNNWSKLSGINSTFRLYDRRGHRSHAQMPEVGYYVEIILPASTLENWVQITDIQQTENTAEFTVHPSEKPKQVEENETEIEHFFIKEASSTFRVTQQGNKLIGFEIGKNEGINNQGQEAGNRAVLNTVVAEGGWALFQEIQWDKITRYFVHLEEIEE